MCPMSGKLFVWLFWFMHCKFFQEESEAEQLYLLRHLSAIYVQVKVPLRPSDRREELRFSSVGLTVSPQPSGGSHGLLLPALSIPLGQCYQLGILLPVSGMYDQSR
jgi:hypothetical protein